MSTTPLSDPQAMPLADLKQAAGLNDPPAPQVAPQPEVAPAPAPVAAPVVPEKFAISSDDSGVTITLSPEYGGEVYKGKDVNEALAKLAGSKADANAYIKTLKSQPAQPAVPAKVPDPVPPDVQATRDWILDEFAKGLGLNGKDDLVANFGSMAKTSNEFSTNVAFAEFHKNCPDYVDTPENSAAVGAYFPNGYKQPSDPQVFAQDLKTAYALARLDGKIIPQAAQTTAAAPRPPLMPGSSATPTGNADQGAWSMPMDQLKKAAGLG